MCSTQWARLIRHHLLSATCRLVAAVKEADPKLLSLLSRAWALGPKHTGPNLLLSSAGSTRGAATLHSGRSSGLWDVPAAQVATCKAHLYASAACMNVHVDKTHVHVSIPRAICTTTLLRSNVSICLRQIRFWLSGSGRQPSVPQQQQRASRMRRKRCAGLTALSCITTELSAVFLGLLLQTGDVF